MSVKRNCLSRKRQIAPKFRRFGPICGVIARMQPPLWQLIHAKTAIQRGFMCVLGSMSAVCGARRVAAWPPRACARIGRELGRRRRKGAAKPNCWLFVVGVCVAVVRWRGAIGSMLMLRSGGVGAPSGQRRSKLGPGTGGQPPPSTRGRATQLLGFCRRIWRGRGVLSGWHRV